MQSNIVWQPNLVTPADRQAALGQRGAVIWFTGLSGSGKSTIAARVEKALCDMGKGVYLLDGDNVRHGLNADLGFSDRDRDENIRRIAHAASLFADSGMIVLVSAISPFRAMRAMARECVKKSASFTEIYVKADVATCARRDPKGLYQKALRGEIAQFTGVSSPYEEPDDAELVLDTTRLTIDECVSLVLSKVEEVTIPYEAILRVAVNASLEAGKAIMEIYRQDFAVYTKADASPLTEADKASDEIIAQALQTAFPHYALLSEEKADDLSRREDPFCFIVDPLDGTKEFIKKNGEFTVNVALAYRGRSVLGVIYAPATDSLYFACKGLGCFFCDHALEKADVFTEAVPAHVSCRTKDLVMMVSRSHLDDATRELMELNRDKVTSTLPSGSSLKGCLVAKGDADLYYRTGPTMEWDTDAMQCICEQAGAIFRQLDDSEMTYNRIDTRNSKGFYIINDAQNRLRRK